MEVARKSDRPSRTAKAKGSYNKLFSKNTPSRRPRHGVPSLSTTSISIQTDKWTYPQNDVFGRDCSGAWSNEFNDYSVRAESLQSLFSISSITCTPPSGAALVQEGVNMPFNGSQGVMDGRLPDIDYTTHQMDNMEHEGRVIMEYLYVTFEKSSDKEKLGLQLTYSPCDDLEGYSDVFVEKIDFESVAGRDGRIRERDQIVQMNGQDIVCFDQALTMLRTAARRMNMLLVRPGFEIPNMYCDIDQSDEYSDASLSQDDQKVTFSGAQEINTRSGSSSYHKSHRDIEAINRDLESFQMDGKFSSCSNSTTRQLLEESAIASPLNSRRSNTCNRLVPRMGTRRDSLPTTPMSNLSLFSQNIPSFQSQPIDYSRRSAQVPCPTQQPITNNNNISKPRVPPFSVQNVHYAEYDVEEGIYEQIISPDAAEKGIQTDTSDFPFYSVPTQTDSYASPAGGAYSSDEQNYAPLYLPLPLSGGPMAGCPESPSAGDIYDRYSVMYTTPVNLEHTIRLQQQLFECQLRQQQSPAVPVSSTLDQGTDGDGSGGDGVNSSLERNAETLRSSEKEQSRKTSVNLTGPKMEWVVKRRPDGSRYVTRRPVGSRLLRERSRHVSHEESSTAASLHGKSSDQNLVTIPGNNRCNKSRDHHNTSRQTNRAGHIEDNSGLRVPTVLNSRTRSPSSKQKEELLYQDNLQRTSPVNQLLSVTII